MWIYLAARYSRREELFPYAQELEEAGHEVCSTWISGAHELPDEGSPAFWTRAWSVALQDFQDLELAEALICFTEAPRSHQSRGGRHVEFGVALGQGKPVTVVGPLENIFHALPQVRQFTQWGPEVLQALARVEAAGRGYDG